jgi:hypothetical protein
MYEWNDSNWGTGALDLNERFARREVERTARRAGLRVTQ